MAEKRTAFGSRFGRRGYLYTVSIIILMVPLTLLLLFYTSTEKSKIEDTSARVRCDELYYFVQDVEYDLERAMLIFGRRAAVYAINDVVMSNRTMWNYTYINCTPYVFDGSGSEAAIAELILCGTLYGEDVEYMVNHTLPTWLDRIDADAREMDYDVNISVLDFQVLPYDAWNFSAMMIANLQFSDHSGYCYYVGENKTLSSMTSIIGLEDPLYPLNTGNRLAKYIYNCDLNVTLDNLAGCSTEDRGNGSGTGNAVFYSNIDYLDLSGYCAACNDSLSSTVMVFDAEFGDCNSFDPDCFDINSSCHFAGAIDYAKDDNESFTQKCNITIPWVAATGKLDNETGEGSEHGRDQSCADGNIYTDACVRIKNVPDCGVYQVILGYDSGDVGTSCYAVSNSTRYWAGCDESERYPEGPSFFDRLDGRLNLSGYYADQAEDNFGTRDIGIETLVSLSDLASHGVSVDNDASWVDYLYWAGYEGCAVGGICEDGAYDFNLDCQHAYFYELDTGCTSGSGVPPETDITSPDNDTPLEGCENVSINGTTDDCDNDVALVEVSINGVWYDAELNGGSWNYTFAPAATDIYDIRARSTDDAGVIGEETGEVIAIITGCPTGDNTPPSAPVLLYPEDDRTNVPRNPTFYWDDSSDASGIYRYQIQVDDTPADWSDMETDEYAWDTIYSQTVLLQNNHDYDWRVRAQDNSGNWGNWSTIWTFKVKN